MNILVITSEIVNDSKRTCLMSTCVYGQDLLISTPIIKKRKILFGKMERTATMVMLASTTGSSQTRCHKQNDDVIYDFSWIKK